MEISGSQPCLRGCRIPAAPRNASLSCACGPLRAWRARASACSVGRVCNFPNQSVSPAFSEIAEAAAELASTPLTWDSSVFVSQRPAAVALTCATGNLPLPGLKLSLPTHAPWLGFRFLGMGVEFVVVVRLNFSITYRG